METGKKEGFNPEIIHLVMEEFSQDLKINTQSVNDLIAAVNVTNNKLEEVKTIIQKSPSGQYITSDVMNKINSISDTVIDTKIMLRERPEPVIQKKEFLLFPEGKADQYFKGVFRRSVLMLIIFFSLCCLYRWAIHNSDNKKEIQLEQLQNDHIHQSWDYLYENNGKDVKKLMEKAYDHAEQKDSI